MDDVELLERMLAGDDKAFTQMVERYHATLVRVARYYVASDATANDVAQETWIAVLRGMGRFEGRSTFKTWLFRILVNRARSIGTKENRVVPIDPAPSPSVAPGRFDEGGLWREPPAPFTDVIEEGILTERIVRFVHAAIQELPEPQRAVVTLRDVEGLSTREVAELLELSEANVRVILHRGRAQVRTAVESRSQGGGT